MKSAVIYARCSTEEQAEKGLSINSQLQSCREWCEKNGYQVIAEFTDDGLSGSTSEERPAFMEMIDNIDRKRINTQFVIIWAYSRFSRSRRDSIVYKALLEKNKVKLISITEPLPEDDMFSGLLEAMIEAMDEIYIKRIRKDTIRQMTQNAKAGFWNGGKPPLGYDTYKKEVNGKDRTFLKINEIEAEWVKIIFSMYANGEKIKTIINKLNQLGAKTKRGKPFQKTSLYSILENPLYLGSYYWNKRNRKKKGSGFSTYKDKSEWIPSSYSIPAIIDELLWGRVQAMREKRKQSDRKRYYSGFWLSGLLKCEKCNVGFYCYKGKESKYDYYRCNKCHMTLRREDVEEAVKKVIRDKINMPEIVNNILRELTLIDKESDREKERIEKILLEIERKILNLTHAIENGVFSPTIKENITKLEIQKLSFENELKKLSIPVSKIKPEIIKRDIDELVEDFFHAESEAEKKNLARFLIQEVRVKPNKTLIIKVFNEKILGKYGAGSRKHEYPRKKIAMKFKRGVYCFGN